MLDTYIFPIWYFGNFEINKCKSCSFENANLHIFPQPTFTLIGYLKLFFPYLMFWDDRGKDLTAHVSIPRKTTLW